MIYPFPAEISNVVPVVDGIDKTPPDKIPVDIKFVFSLSSGTIIDVSS